MLFRSHLLAQNVIQALVLLIGLAFKDLDNLSVFPLAPVEILWVYVLLRAASLILVTDLFSTVS